MKMKIFYGFFLAVLCYSSMGFCETMQKEDENHFKRVAYGLSNIWHRYGGGFQIIGALEGPESWIDHPIIIFDLYIDKPYPPKAGEPYEIRKFALVSIGPKKGLCKIQPYSIDPSKVESFSCDGEHIRFKWGCYDVNIIKGEKHFTGDHKCHILFSERYWDETSKEWVEKKWKSVDHIKLGEVILR